MSLRATKPGSASLRPWVMVVGDTVITRKPDVDQRLRALLSEADITVVNLEVPLTDEGEAVEKAATHRANPQMATCLTELGVNVVTLANNHAMDFGRGGLDRTLQALRDAGLAHVGAGVDLQAARAPRYDSTEAGTVAFLGMCTTLPPGFAATENGPGVSPLRILQQVSLDPALAAEQPGMAPFVHTQVHGPDLVGAIDAVAAAKARADTVIVLVHWGIPHGFAPASYGTLAQYQRPVGQALIAAGATLVVGHHPHAVHPIEIVDGGLIAYSVGNFMFHNWDHFSGQAHQQSDDWHGDDSSPFPLQVPGAPYRSAFNDPETLDSVVVLVSKPKNGELTIRFLPTTMVHGDPVIPDAGHCHSILDRLDNQAPNRKSSNLSRRTDLVSGAVLGELTLHV